MMRQGTLVETLTDLMKAQWVEGARMPATLLEQRILEIERLGLLDVEDADGLPSSARQFAMASLRVTPPPFFITMDEELLTFRPVLEARYGLRILSFPEAVLLLRETDGPPN
ncbi:MAG: hypothetical protein BWY76_00468 [bacterium ADurb.Bin429]|mgnify:CR=1 FL=1|nr:MAG: hypothetical protein BWY76_00468 [bacterium ADurb.Bin429]